jgi:monooxygenase
MSVEHFDVLIVGAGLSGIGAAYHLQEQCPGKTFVVLEARDEIGGTWDLFRYPGIRSDSDMYTLGYRFRPWRDAKSIADGPSILEYVRDTARENGIEKKIRFGHRAVRAEWSSEQARWTLEVQLAESDEIKTFSASFLLMCSGYYRYDEGYTPAFAGSESFGGQIVHPQHWSDDIDYANKRVVVIGSGATAVTLVPALAQDAAHVTMLQRSPTYIVSLPGEDPIAKRLRRVLPLKLVYPIVRWKNVLLTMLSFQLSRRRPEVAKAMLRKGLERRLPPDYDIDTHFKPSYGPWRQRLCLVPDGDLFEAISDGRASVVTDQIERFTENGIALVSGAHLDADMIVTATGLNMLPLGGIQLVVGDEEVALGKTMSYRGMMLSGVPNLAVVFGYTNASWTLKADLTSEYVCRLLNHMSARGYATAVPKRDPSMPEQPFIDFSSGYVVRAIDRFPRQGERAPWRLYQNYPLDIVSLRYSSIEDGTLQFATAATMPAAAEPVAA